jgi:energy-coupling factor transporter transmembrane protein EcfT
MPLSGFVQKAIKDFLIIFALIIIVITFLRQIYYPDMAFDLKSIYIIMGFSFLSALTGFILYSPNNISDMKMRIRMVIHFITLEIILIAIGSVFNIVDSVSDVVILALQIAVIYTIVRLLSWQFDKKEAQKMNEKLKAFKNDI